jgi:hypothetical protein
MRNKYKATKNYKKEQNSYEEYEVGSALPAIKLSHEVIGLGKYLDEIYKSSQIGSLMLTPSKILEGAFYVIRPECRSNPDWMSQASNSLREILYPFHKTSNINSIFSLYMKYMKDKKILNKISSKKFFLTLKKINELYLFFQDVTHHGIDPKIITNKPTEKEFLKKVDEFLISLLNLIELKALYIHALIDAILNRRPSDGIKDASILLNLIDLEEKNYFFKRANEKWLMYLWNKGLLDSLKQGSKDSYNNPEIRYLVRMAKSQDRGTIIRVIEIITNKDLAIYENKFNPELIYQILRILADWPAEYIKEALKGLGEDKVRTWIKIMAPFGITITFSLERIMKKLVETKEYGWAIKFADFVLSVKSKKDFKVNYIKVFDTKIPKGEVTPFYIYDLDHTQVFENFEKIINFGNNIELIEQIFSRFSKKFEQILNLTQRKEDDFFGYDDTEVMPLYTIDLFNLEMPSETTFDYKVKAFLYVLKLSFDKIVKYYRKENPRKIKEIFERNIGYSNNINAPIKKNSRSIWAFRLYALSQAPEIFKEHIKKMLFEPINNNPYSCVIYKPEYINVLKKNFSTLFSSEEKRKFLNKLYNDFKTELTKDRNYKTTYGWFLCFIQKDDIFRREFRKKFEGLSVKILENCNVTAEVGPVTFYRVKPKHPKPIISQEEFNKLSIDELIKKLKGEWSSRNLSKIDSPTKPGDIEFLLKGRVRDKFQEIVNNLPKFFDKDIHPRYLHSFLSGMKENFLENRETDFKPFFKIVEEFKNKGKKWFVEEDEKINSTDYFGWVAQWRSVHRSLAELIKIILQENDGKTVIDFNAYRNDIFNTLKYLLHPDTAYPDPSVEDEIKKIDSNSRINTPMNIAINSVRGEAFEAFVHFVFWDSKRMYNQHKLEKDVKDLFKTIIEKEITRTMMFIYAYYTPTFHYRDRNWFVKKIMPMLFGKKDKDLKLAAEEGYLSQNLYREIFQDVAFRELYKEWIKNPYVDYSNNQEHFKHLDDALADHLAIGYIYDLDFDMKTDIFTLFWNVTNQRRWKEFITFIGRHLQNQKNYLNSKEKIKKRLLKLWEFILEKKKLEDSEVLSAFGEWVDEKIDIFTDEELVKMVSKILKKSKGAWENQYSLFEKLSNFSQFDLRKTLNIIRNFFIIEYDKEEKKRRSWLVGYGDYREKIKIIFEKAAKDKKLKKEAEKLISDLIENLGEPFWFLEDLVLRNN